jgi:hypothetical protein
MNPHLILGFRRNGVKSQQQKRFVYRVGADQSRTFRSLATLVTKNAEVFSFAHAAESGSFVHHIKSPAGPNAP